MMTRKPQTLNPLQPGLVSPTALDRGSPGDVWLQGLQTGNVHFDIEDSGGTRSAGSETLDGEGCMGKARDDETGHEG